MLPAFDPEANSWSVCRGGCCLAAQGAWKLSSAVSIHVLQQSDDVVGVNLEPVVPVAAGESDFRISGNHCTRLIVTDATVEECVR